MKVLDNWSLFLEKKEDGVEVEKEVRKILAVYFSGSDDIIISDGCVEFEVSKLDFNLDYSEEPLTMGYSQGVLKKRKYEVSLSDPIKIKEDGIFKIKMKINLKPTSGTIGKGADGGIVVKQWDFGKKPKDTIRFLKLIKCKYFWNDEDKILSIDKADFVKISAEDREELAAIINDDEGAQLPDAKELP